MSDEQSGRRVPPEPDDRRANRFAIGHDAFQFRFDFWQEAEEPERPVTRIITNPSVAKDFSQTLCESLRDFDRRAGLEGLHSRKSE